jgi:chromosome segregation ATPase
MMHNIAEKNASLSLSQKDARAHLLEMEQMKHIIKLLGSEVKSARETVEKLFQEKKVLEQRLDLREASFFQECRKMQEENKALNSQCESYASLLSENSILKQSIEQLERATQERVSCDEAAKKIKETSPSPQLARLAMELSKTQEEVHGLTCERAALLRAHKEATQEIKQLQEESQVLQSKLTLYEQEESGLKKEKEINHQEREILQSQILSLQSLHEKEKETSFSLSSERQAIQALFDLESQEKTALQIQYSAIENDLALKNITLQTLTNRINTLEEEYKTLLEENREAEKRITETEEILFLKLSNIDECEGQIELLKEVLTTLEEENKKTEKDKKQLEEELSKEQNKATTLTDRNEALSKDLELIRQKSALASNRLNQLDGWKRRADQALHHIRASIDGFSEYEKYLEQESAISQKQMPFAEEMAFLKPMTQNNGSLF